MFSFRKKKQLDFFSTSLTQELKGLAILAILFAHIGYYLVSDQRFLFPLTIAAGVGVNMFLFLSGYGLIISSLQKELSLKQFYLRRLPKLYLPLWLSCLLFLALDFLVYGKVYSLSVISQASAGFFSRADVALDLNSPLWYFTFIVFYYLLFPLVLSRRWPWLSAGLLYLAGYLLMKWDPQFLREVMRLYQVHILAFPLGVLLGSLPFWLDLKNWREKLARFLPQADRLDRLKKLSYWPAVILLFYVAGYTAYYSHVGAERWLEEATSLVTMFALIILFLMKKIENRLLYLFGIYSYEIYLLHWPILSRFDLFYRFMPAWLATVGYLFFFIAIAWTLRKLADKLSGLVK